MNETTTRRTRYLEDARKLSDREIREFTYVETRDLSYVVRVEQNSKIKTLWAWRLKWIGGGKVASVVLVLTGLVLGVLKWLG